MTDFPAGHVALREAMDAYGQGFAWHVEEHAELFPHLAVLRSAVADDAHAPGTAPLCAEGALAMAGRALANQPAAARILLIDTDPRLADVATLLGHEVVARVPADRLELWSGVRSRCADVVVLDSGVHQAAPEEHERAFDLAWVDAQRYAEAMVPLLAHALWSVRVGGGVSLALHPQQREHARGVLKRVPASLRDRHDECCGRLIASAGKRGLALQLADYPADQWILEVEEGDLPTKPSRALGKAQLQDHDPSYARHGMIEVHDVIDAEDNGAALESALALAAERAGFGLSGTHAKDRDAFFHRFAATEPGGHFAAALDRTTGVLSCEVWKWSPHVESALASAFVDTLARADDAVRFDHD